MATLLSRQLLGYHWLKKTLRDLQAFKAKPKKAKHAHDALTQRKQACCPCKCGLLICICSDLRIKLLRTQILQCHISLSILFQPSNGTLYPCVHHHALALISASTSHSHDLYTKIYLEVDKVCFQGKLERSIQNPCTMSMFIHVQHEMNRSPNKRRHIRRQGTPTGHAYSQLGWTYKLLKSEKKYSCCTISLSQVFTQADRRQYQRVGAFQNLGVTGTQ